MKTYPNQKLVEIMKSPCDKKHAYGMMNAEALEIAAKDLSATDFKLYIYLASNQDGYAFGLSKKDFMAWANCQENTYRSAVKSLIEKGYLVQEQNRWIFLDKPVENTIEKKEEKPTPKVVIEYEF